MTEKLNSFRLGKIVRKGISFLTVLPAGFSLTDLIFRIGLHINHHILYIIYL